MKKVGIISLGCSKNLVDSENILGLLDKCHYHIVNSADEADIIIINTCGFINSSKKESIDTILEFINKDKKVVVTGCLVERYYDDLVKEIPEVDLFLPIRDYPRFNQLLSQIDEDLNDDSGVSDDFRVVSTGKFSAYLKIGEGCSNRCAYCAIPLIRGDFASREMDSIIKEANKLAKQGYKEIVVLQQDTTKYGVDLHNGENIVILLKKLLEIKDFDYIRLLYLYPDEITDELIELIGSEPRLTPYFDIPIQHSETKILRSMNRRGNKQYLINLFKKIRKKVPNAILRTTVMVGFPGETKRDFDNLKKFISEIRFDHLGAFKYSREENTPAYDYPHQVRESTKEKRLNEIMKLQQKISYSKNKEHIGSIMTGLVIGKEKDLYLLRSYFNAPDDIDGKIFFKSSKTHDLGEKVTVKITDSFIYDLLGEEVI